MPNVVVPASGWSLGTAAESITNGKGPGGTPNLVPGIKQLMRIQFTEGALLEDLIKAGEFKVSFGKTIVSRDNQGLLRCFLLITTIDFHIRQ